MHCPFCGVDATRVVDSRLAAEGGQVKRRRECPDCGSRFTTFEIAELVMPRIVKNDGTPEPFNEAKLRRGITQALYKRPVKTDAVDTAISRITHRLRTESERDVPSRKLGNWVMEELRELDQVAFVRFASVYRRFEDVNAFREEIERLESTPDRTQARRQLSLIESGTASGPESGPESDKDSN